MGILNIIQKIKQKRYTNNVKNTCLSYGKNLKVNNKSIVNQNTSLKDNVNFNGMHIQGKGKVNIGSNFHSGIKCMIITDFHNYEGDAIPYDNTVISKDVIIEDNVWIGNRVIILGGTHIGEGAIIQAGSVVVNDIPKYGIAGGHPAKVFKYRDIDHYKKLKKEKKFH
ncbi:acetyltransferase [Methanobrevibacter sp. 87.7]|uniref:acyltransferase n=1 Tax=Methanobrevibacter sp. 87.7 TaxID=387957 RepID=UPI000B50FD22|nr:acyltransferase [Methanobrevibacter sp. 87.7]OWT33194.1 acetyltransferase [Methanobrevibacter sp. 87.7]